jgi:hypothetical protein
MIAWQRGGDDHGAHAGGVKGIMATQNGDSEACEVAAGIRPCVAPCDSDTPPDQKLRQTAHSGAGDPNEVNRALIRGIDERHVLAVRI